MSLQFEFEFDIMKTFKLQLVSGCPFNFKASRYGGTRSLRASTDGSTACAKRAERAISSRSRTYRLRSASFAL